MRPTIPGLLAPVPGSARGLLNSSELRRALAASGVLSGLVTLAIAALRALAEDAGSIFPDPGAALFATAFFALLIDLLRRLGHGETPAPAAPSPRAMPPDPPDAEALPR